MSNLRPAGDSAVVEQLVKRDANPNILAACGVSPLHAAAEYGDEATVRILIEVRIKENEARPDVQTAILMA